jgi:hypothetical protein
MGTKPRKNVKEQDNQGEGNKEADRRYREKTREFIDAGKVEKAAEDAADMTESELASARRAEEIGKTKARK